MVIGKVELRSCFNFGLTLLLILGVASAFRSYPAPAPLKNYTQMCDRGAYFTRVSSRVENPDWALFKAQILHPLIGP